MSEYLYDAFISYSHRDLKWGRWLQRKLEGYRAPRALAGAEAGEKAGKRRLRIFRDQTDLAGAELMTSLHRELERARYLIVLCSPASAASRWVEDEIRYFCSLGRKDRIIPFIISGEPMSDRADLECFPPTLRGPETDELLGVNIQEIGKRKSLLKVISILLDVRFNRLVDRDRQRRRRTAVTAGSVTAAALLVTGGLLNANARLSRDNDRLGFDIYGFAMMTLQLNESLQPEAIEFLRISAEKGNDQAMLYLASTYKQGFGTPKDPELAFYWFQRAAEKGNTQGMIGVASCYTEGIGTPKNLELAASLLLKAAEAGDPEAMVLLGGCNMGGNGIARDPAEGFRWYQKAADAGYPDGMNKLGIALLTGTGTEPDPERGFSWMLRAAELGDAPAMYMVGQMYADGNPVPPNPDLAYAWFKKAAAAGDANAQYALGQCIENSFGVSTTALATEWYRKAAENGHSGAQARLAELTPELLPSEAPAATAPSPAP